VTVKIVSSILIIAAVCGFMFWGLERYSDVMDELSELSGNIITSADIADSIDSFYELESYFEERELFISLFIHDAEVEELRAQMIEIITLLFNGDRDSAIISATLFRQRIISLGEAILPSFSNIV